jgi:RND family efflux transporter MFP subunit
MPKRLAVALCSAWVVLIVAGCRTNSAGESDALASQVPATRVLASGRVEGWQEADVASKLPGRVLSFVYGEGDEVEKDAPVVQLEDRDLRTAVRQAEARVVESAAMLRRMRTLAAEGTVSAAELDHAEAAYLTSAAALDQARVILDYATIRAPFRGTLLHKFKEVGEGVMTTALPDPLFRIADLSHLKVTAEVPESEIGAVEVGQQAAVTADAYPSESFPATVSRVGLAVGRRRVRSDDPRERRDEKVVEVELVLHADARLRSGMTVDVAVRVDRVLR